MDQPAQPSSAHVPAEDVVRARSDQPAVLLVRTTSGWTVLRPAVATGWMEAHDTEDEGLTLVEAMSVADLVAAEFGATPEPDRATRRAARAGSEQVSASPDADPRDEEIAALRRTVGQLEHALAARVSIERAIGVLAERHGTTPREAFDQLRRHARAQGRPLQELAAEVLDGLPARSVVLGQRGTPAAGPTARPTPEPRPTGSLSSARRMHRTPRRGSGDAVPGAQH